MAGGLCGLPGPPEEHGRSHAMNIFITGGTGFLGNEVLKALHARRHRLTALVRSPERASRFPQDVRLVPGAVENPASYQEALEGPDAGVRVAALGQMRAPDAGDVDV